MSRTLIAAALACTMACADEPEVSQPLPTPTLSDFAGSWSMTVIFPEQGDTVRSTLSGSEKANDWVMVNPGNQRVRMPTVSLKGDSMILVSEKFAAVVRPGATAQVRTGMVLREGVIEGKLVATFDLPDGTQSVRAGTLTATRNEQ